MHNERVNTTVYLENNISKLVKPYPSKSFTAQNQINIKPPNKKTKE
jgi:hypothetical protein